MQCTEAYSSLAFECPCRPATTALCLPRPEAPPSKQGNNIPVLNASHLAAADVVLRASANGFTLAKMCGSQEQIKEEHKTRERLMVEHWEAFRTMWSQYYVRCAEDLRGEVPSYAGKDHATGGDVDDDRESAGGSADDEEFDEGLGLWKSDWLKYVRECKESADEVWMPHLRLFDGGTWET